MPIYKTEGVVLSRRPWREHDRLYSIYTRDYGRWEIVAKGARKIKSKLAGHLEPGSLTRLMIANGRNFDTLTGASLIKPFKPIKNNLQKIILANYGLEAVNQLTKPHAQDKKILDLIKDFLRWLALAEKNLWLGALTFIWKLLGYLGFKAELSFCLLCKKKIGHEQMFFDFSLGGLVCGHHSKKPLRLAITSRLITILKTMEEKGLESIKEIKIDRAELTQLNKIITNYLNYHLEKKLKTEEFIKKCYNNL